MKKFSIAHIESSLNWGGQELRIIEQTQWLINNGYKTIIIARPKSKILIEAHERKLPYFELEIKGSVHLLQIFKLIYFLKKNKIDILDAHSSRDASYAMFVKFFTNIKVIRSRHVTNRIKNDFFHAFIWRYGSHAIITTANKIKSDIVNLKLFDKNKIFVAPAGVDETKFSLSKYKDIQSLKEKHSIPKNDIIIANIGMIRGDKGQYYYFKMCEILAKKYPNITFLQIGEATRDTQKYKAKILEEYNKSDYKSRIHFLGYKSNIQDYIAISDIVVIASVGTEAMTRLVSQCFFMKKNIVATNVGGLPEMIEDKVTGLLSEPRDPQALANNVESILENQSLKIQYQQNAFKYAQENFTFSSMMEFMINTYNFSLRSREQ
jgi:glycosyltransferase involved in cell wall biosynthesis